MDNEHSFDHDRKGCFGLANFSVDWNGFIRNEVSADSEWATEEIRNNRMVERIVVMGVDALGTTLVSFDIKDT